MTKGDRGRKSGCGGRRGDRGCGFTAKFPISLKIKSELGQKICRSVNIPGGHRQWACC